MNVRLPLWKVIASITSFFCLSQTGRGETWEKILSKQQKINSSAILWDLDKDKLVTGFQENHALIPASLTKLLSTYSYLKILGRHYRTKTVISTDEIKGSTIKNLYWKGYGDPRLVTEFLYLISQELRLKGITHITGNLIIDDTYFDGVTKIPSSDGRTESRAYNASLSATSFNFNTITVRALQENGKCKLGIDPLDNNYAKLTGTLKGNDPPWATFFKASQDHEEFRVSGGCHPKPFYVSVANPSLNTGHFFKSFLERQGVTFAKNSTVALGTQPKNPQIILEFPSEYMGTWVQLINTYSNNFMAEMVLKIIGAAYAGEPGTSEKGLSALRKVLEMLPKSEPQWQITNASGLSDENKLSARQIVEILRWSYQDMDLYASMLNSLPKPGEEGTLVMRHRLKALVDGGNLIFGKTGTLFRTVDVNGIAGYVQTVKKRKFAFCILMNSRAPAGGQLLDDMKKLQDQLLEAVIEL